MDEKREEIRRITEENISSVRKIVFSLPRDPSVVRVEAKPIILKGEKFFCFETFTTDNKAMQKNIAFSDVPEYASELAVSDFRQTNIITSGGDCTVLVSKKGKITVIDKIKSGAAVQPAAHNREKKYIIDAKENAAFLSALGVCDENGNVFDKKRAKFRQINRFIELLDDVYDSLPKEETLTVCDLCSGKSYLTFAVYHYLTAIKNRKAEMYGVDLKADVIDYCEKLSQKLGFDGLHFICADISTFKTENPPDLVVSLHACDTATDEALARGVEWKARYIVSAPCCQHELQKAIGTGGGKSRGEGEFAGLLRQSILRERLCDILTDSFRAQILRIMGYRTQVLEFVSPDATARNIMLKCEYGVKPGQSGPVGEYLALRDFWNVTPWLETRLSDSLGPLLERYG